MNTTGLIGEAEESLVAAFNRSASLFPSRTALISDTCVASYREVAELSDRVAKWLIARDPECGSRVAILMEHGAAMVVAILATLKAGKVVVVLNEGHPSDRLRTIIDTAEPSLIVADLAHHAVAKGVARAECQVISYEAACSDTASIVQLPCVCGDDVAFLVFTSGTTGRPKGVVISHRMVRRCALVYRDVLGITPDDRVTLLGSPSGSQGVWTIWCALAYGAALCPYSTSGDGFIHLAYWLRRRSITVYISSASIFRTLVRTLDDGIRFDAIRVVRLASEPISDQDMDLCRRHLGDQCTIVHSLASSEGGNIACYGFAIDADLPPGRLPVGEALQGIEIRLIGSDGCPVRSGETGEIVLRGRYLADGYWRDDELTSKRFRRDGGDSGVRCFYTGDIGRIDRNGRLVFMGRTDTQVKIRGNTVDTSEIVETLRRVPGVAQAAVTTDAGADGVRLSAYVVASASHVHSPGALRAALRAQVPEYMVPSRFRFLKALPLNPHGKIDYDGLRLLSVERAASTAFDPPVTDTEKLLGKIWESAFEVSRVGRNDDFFDLGGDSLIAAVISAQVHAETAVSLHLGAYIDGPRLADVARLVDRLSRSHSRAAVFQPVPAARDRAPLSFYQERIWAFSQTREMSTAYNIAKRYQILGRLDVEALRACLAYMAGRHDLLRASFVLAGEQPVQILCAPSPVTLDLVDLTGHSDPEAAAARHLESEATHHFDLAVAPLVRMFLLRLGEAEHHLSIVCHHIICDGQSWSLYVKQLALLYAAQVRGLPPPLAAREPLQYSDYSVWQRAKFGPGSPASSVDVAWWKNRLGKAPGFGNSPFRPAASARKAAIEDGSIRWKLAPGANQRLDQIGRANLCTFFSVRLACLSALLAAEMQVPRVVVGTYISNRSTPALQQMFGFFANLVTLVMDCRDTEMQFVEWLGIVQSVTAEAELHGEVPYEMLTTELQKQGIKLPEIQVILRVMSRSPLINGENITIRPVERSRATMPWGFSVNFVEDDEAFDFEATFDADLYDKTSVRKFVERYGRLLECVSREPEASIRELVAAI